MKKRPLIIICLVVAGLVGCVFVRVVPIGAFSIPYFVASIDEGHQVTGMPWRIVYNDAGAAHSGNFWTWVIEDRGICRVVVAQGYSTFDVRYGDSPIPVKVEDGSIYLGFANSRYGDELDWQKINTRKSIAEVPKALEKPLISIPQSSDPPVSWFDGTPREENEAEQGVGGQPATRRELEIEP
jgi:hypothetical protein